MTKYLRATITLKHQRKKWCSQSGALQPNIIAINMITLYALFAYFDSFHAKYLCQLASLLFMVFAQW